MEYPQRKIPQQPLEPKGSSASSKQFQPPKRARIWPVQGHLEKQEEQCGGSVFKIVFLLLIKSKLLFFRPIIDTKTRSSLTVAPGFSQKKW